MDDATIQLSDALRIVFADHFGGVPDVIARAPGRVNLIGEHTDYNDGFVLPCAISRQTLVAVRPRADGMVNVISGDLRNARDSFSVREPITRSCAEPWSNYVRGMVHQLRANGIAIDGADIAILGDMPQGAGLSSSAALENALGLGIAAAHGYATLDRAVLARMGQLTEHEFAGCNCGIMDQMVSADARASSAMLLDCRSLAHRSVPIPDDLAVLIVHSGVTRGLVDGAYNERRQQCETAAAAVGKAALRDVTLTELEQSEMDAVVRRRARHVVTENARVLSMEAALHAGDRGAIHTLMAQSHHSMRNDFEITVPPIDALVAVLTDALEGEGGARMTGGGFGGAVVALVPKGRLSAVQDAVQRGYRTPDGTPPLMQIERPMQGASILP